MTIDWNKPLQTKMDKWPVRLIGKVNNSAYPNACAVTRGGFEDVWAYSKDGRWSYSVDWYTDLENVPEEPLKFEGYLQLCFSAFREIIYTNYEPKDIARLSPESDVIIDLSTLKPENFVRVEK